MLGTISKTQPKIGFPKNFFAPTPVYLLLLINIVLGKIRTAYALFDWYVAHFPYRSVHPKLSANPNPRMLSLWYSLLKTVFPQNSV